MQERAGKSKVTQVTAAIIGNALEWYDFAVFGFLTPIIATVFFPKQDDYSALLLTTATFGVGFVTRPFGGALVGIFADKKGRKAALQLLIAIMALATALIAVAPPYASVGIAGAVMIVIARLLQGVAAGGEWASATALLIEMAPPGRRGLYGSWQGVGQGLSLLLGSVAGALVTKLLPQDALYSWGWRLPFVFGLIIIPVGIWIRRYLEEPGLADYGASTSATEDMSMVQALRLQGRAFAATFLITSCFTIAFYVLIVYIPTFASRNLKLALDDVFLIQCLATSVMIVLTPVFGALSDRIGRRPVLVTGMALYLVLLIPMYNWVLEAPSNFRLAVTQVILLAALSLSTGSYAAALAEQFTAKVRSTGLAIAYNVAVVVFGGFAQFFVTWLLGLTGSLLTPIYYLLFGATLGLVGCLMLREGARGK